VPTQKKSSPAVNILNTTTEAIEEAGTFPRQLQPTSLGEKAPAVLTATMQDSESKTPTIAEAGPGPDTDTDTKVPDKSSLDVREDEKSKEKGSPEAGDTDVERQDAQPLGGMRPEMEHPRAHLKKWQWELSMLGLLLGGLLYGLDTTISADVQVPIYQTFQDIENLPWVGLGFPMSAVSVILLMGRAFSLFNTKTLTLASIAMFEIGSAVCGAAPSSTALIIGRIIAGIGGCGMYLGGLNYVNHYTVGKEVPMYNALIGMSWGLGAILGPIIGGAFSVSSATWRWAFYINLPLCALFCPIYFFIFPSVDPRPDMPILEKLRRVDWVGGVLMIPIITLFMTAITFAGSKYEWDSAATIAMLVVWFVSFVFFVLQQRYSWFTTPKDRIFPVRFLKDRTMVLLFAGTALSAVGQSVPLFYVPLFFQFTQPDASALTAAVRLLPFIIVFIVFVFAAGALLPVVGRPNIFYIISGVLVLCGAAGMMTVRSDSSNNLIYGMEVLMAAGTGLTGQTAYAIAGPKAAREAIDALIAETEGEVDAQEAKRVGVEAGSMAASFINVSQMGFMALALSLCAVLFQNLGFQFLKDELSPFGLADEMIRGLLSGASSSLPGGSTQIVQIVIDTIAYTISRTYALTLVAGGLLLVTGLSMKWEKMEIEFAAGG
jgi:MFS family permease